jgi:hypothetical protein
MIKHAALIALLYVVCASARADTIYSEDFQSGTSKGWLAMGKGDVRLSTYGKNVSLELTAGAVAVKAVSTAGFSRVRLSVAFAALSLAGDDSCIADVSADAGHNWSVVSRVGHGQDDGLTMHTGRAEGAIMDNQPKLVIRLRNAAANPHAICWADNILLSGDKGPAVVARPAFAADGTRLALTYDQLTNAAIAPFPADMSAFAPPASALPPSNIFQGMLSLGTERPGSTMHVLTDQFGDSSANNGAAGHLPVFDFAFVQSGDALIPVRRGAIPANHPQWEFILEPGRVWDEAADHGLTRAAVPFSLEERNANCMHNGVLTFLFGKSGKVSDVAWQIGSETCIYFKFDMWGRAAAVYTPGAVADAARIAADYAQETASRMPTRPIETLAHDYPGADPSNFGSAGIVPASDIALYGLVADGVNYVGGCETRFGLYPYCAVMDLPSYSLAKSIFAGLGTMRLSLLYPGVTKEIIANYVPDCAAAGTWNEVTFGNALDMATGHFNSSDDQADENAPDLSPFFLAEDHATRIKFACTHYPRKAAPGTHWVYHTADTYILGTALGAFYRDKAGASADLYHDVLAVPIWKKLALSPPFYVVRRTYDATAQPFTGYGLTLHGDDIAKIADFINVDHGAIGGEQLVDPAMLRAALQQNPEDHGLRASTDDFRYHDGFWAWNAQHTLGCESPTWIPFMSGFGGIAVALMPNGMTYYYFSDSGVWVWSKAASEANRLKPFCKR